MGVQWQWWRLDMEMLSALQALCKGNLPVTKGFTSQSVSIKDLIYLLLLAWSYWANRQFCSDAMTLKFRHYNGPVRLDRQFCKDVQLWEYRFSWFTTQLYTGITWNWYFVRMIRCSYYYSIILYPWHMTLLTTDDHPSDREYQHQTLIYIYIYNYIYIYISAIRAWKHISTKPLMKTTVVPIFPLRGKPFLKSYSSEYNNNKVLASTFQCYGTFFYYIGLLC